MRPCLAFDVYGTLIDTSDVLGQLEITIGEKALLFMQLWRDKQLEYSFRRAAMNAYVDFSICTSDALHYCCSFFQIELPSAQRQELLDTYRRLPAFTEVENAMATLKSQGYPLFAFSNGSTVAVTELLDRTGLLPFFNGVISVEQVQMFKPSPLVYEHFNRQSGSTKAQSYLISGNAFDIMGALSYGMRAVWVQRKPTQVFDSWEGLLPDGVVTDLTALVPFLNATH